MSVPGKKLYYETARGLCTVVGIRSGLWMEIRRFGKTFIDVEVPGLPEECIPASQRRKFATEAQWREWVDREAVAPGSKIYYETAKGTCAVVRIRDGRLLEIRRFGTSFTPEGCACGKCYLPYSARRKFATEAEWRSAIHEAGAGSEERFWTRIEDMPCSSLFQKPTAKNAAPRWEVGKDVQVVWIGVQTDRGIIPVFRNKRARILRFMVDGRLLTFAEANIPVDAPLWRRRDAVDPTLVPV
jgi:hypothetical protein